MIEITEISEIKKIALDLLIKFDAICTENKLRYAVSWGTLLGAVRHKGFIPWDDDIDVDMPREDYNKLLKIAATSEWKSVKIISHNSDVDYPYVFAKFINTDTVLEENIRAKYELGVYLDIFPLDGLPKDAKKAQRHMKKLYFYDRLLVFSLFDYTTPKSIIKLLIKKPVMYILHLLDYGKLVIKLDNELQRYTIDESELVGVLFAGFKAVVRKDVALKYTKLEFCGSLVNAPLMYDEILRNLYGDYLTLPPENERVSNHSFKAWWK